MYLELVDRGSLMFVYRLSCYLAFVLQKGVVFIIVNYVVHGVLCLLSTYLYRALPDLWVISRRWIVVVEYVTPDKTNCLVVRKLGGCWGRARGYNDFLNDWLWLPINLFIVLVGPAYSSHPRLIIYYVYTYAPLPSPPPRFLPIWSELMMPCYYAPSGMMCIIKGDEVWCWCFGVISAAAVVVCVRSRLCYLQPISRQKSTHDAHSLSTNRYNSCLLCLRFGGYIHTFSSE